MQIFEDGVPQKLRSFTFRDGRTLADIPSSRVAGSFQIHMSVLGLVKDGHGQIVAKVSNDLSYRAPIEKQANFAQRKVTLPLHLPPGRYQLQTAVIDREVDQASVKKSVLMVPTSGTSSLGVSDIVWVRSVKANQTPDPGNPLDSPQGEITPELEPTLARTDSAVFYFTVYPPRAARDRPEAQIAVIRDGKV